MNPPNPFLFALYRRALCLYPHYLRLRYQDQMLQNVRDAHADAPNSILFWPSLFTDLLQSSVKEHLLMIQKVIREQAIARPIFFHALTLGIVLTLFGCFATFIFQGLLRRGANEPQIQMGAAYASKIESGIKPADAIPRNNVDIENSLEPFTIFYDDDGAPVTATGHLNQTIPTPPAGVFNYVRSHAGRTDNITWQPQPDVRIAAIVRRISGPHPGYLITGRSLRLVEEQENILRDMVFGGWFLVVFLLIAGAALLSRSQLKPINPA
jgi:hypothetical protein